MRLLDASKFFSDDAWYGWASALVPAAEGVAGVPLDDICTYVHADIKGVAVHILRTFILYTSKPGQVLPR